MEYMTIKEAARLWNVSERLVQRYCTEDRIEGAFKFNNSWAIPMNTDKPEDPRKKLLNIEYTPVFAEDEHIDSGHTPMPLLNSSYIPGHCFKLISQMENTDQKNIALAEYYYFSGQAAQCAEIVRPYLNHSDIVLRMSANLLCIYSSLTLNKISDAQYVMSSMEKELNALNDQTPAEIHAIVIGISTAAKVLLHLPLENELPSAQQYIHLLPPGFRLFAFYVQAHYAYLNQKYGECIGIVQTAIAFQGECYPIPTIYLHLIATMAYMSLKDPDTAKEHLLAAWDLARPDDFIQPLAEHHGLLGGMLEAVIKRGWPDYFRRMIAITYEFSAGWRQIHNTNTGNDVADNLTTTEFAVAMLAARGWSNKEIGVHLGVSANTVKQHVSVTLQKLGVTQRKELTKYMLT